MAAIGSRAGDLVAAIGSTPLVELQHLRPEGGAHLYAKLEMMNPTGSVKDRVARSLIEAAEAEGALSPGQVVLEPTSGNTGISLAAICRARGYRMRAVMPESATPERADALRMYGAEIVWSPGHLGSNGAVALARELAASDPDVFMPFQYGNPANPDAHYEGTGAEIVRDLPEVTHFIAGLGTGGTLMGVGRRLHEHDANVKIVAAEPELGDLVYGLRSLEEGFIPPIFEESILDRKFLVNSSDALRANRDLTEQEGIFAGISSGAVVHVARRVAAEVETANIVCLLPDGGWKYLSTEAWAPELEQAEKQVAETLWW